MQADMDELVYVKFEGPMADALTQIDPNTYKKFEVKEKGKTVIYAALRKALYGTLRGSLLFWKHLVWCSASWQYRRGRRMSAEAVITDAQTRAAFLHEDTVQLQAPAPVLVQIDECSWQR